MVNEPLHKLFHDLSGPINTINTMSQICVSYITTFDMEKLEGDIKEDFVTAYKNIFPCKDDIIKQLKLVVSALNKIGSQDIGDTLQEYINYELKELKKAEESSERAFNNLLEHDIKENLLRFGEKIKKFQPICQSMVKTMNLCKSKLTALGKY